MIESRTRAAIAWEGAIPIRMTLGDLLVRWKLITVEQMNQALELQAAQGGRFGDHLVSTGAITREALDAFIHRTPPEPDTLEATGIDPNELVALLMQVDLDGRIPSQLYVAVAELLAWLYRVEQREVIPGEEGRPPPAA